MSALGGELARQSIGVRQATMALMAEATGMIAAHIPGNATGRAIALDALLMGTLQLSGIAVTLEERDMILTDGWEAARILVRG